jgi:hypothetical protein
MFYSEDCLIRLIYRIYYTISRLKVFWASIQLFR